MLNEIEEKMISIEPNACRVCTHFMRVNFDTIHNVTNRQGVCLLGQLEGDWGLYVSSSISTKCIGFVYSDQNAKIHKAEKQLSDEFKEFAHSLHDKRTANYKAVKNLDVAHKEFTGTIAKGRGDLPRMMSYPETHKFASECFVKMQSKRYRKVYDMVSLKKVHYIRFLAGVSMQIHDKFCERGEIELIHAAQEAKQ